MKWFVFQQMLSNGPGGYYYVNAQHRASAKNRLAAFVKRFKKEGTFEIRNDSKPLETLVHCWHEYGMVATVVYKDD